ncbi:MAG: mechanosensitive ion channel family protein [Candidatus Syntropharchaeia archaeon]
MLEIFLPYLVYIKAGAILLLAFIAGKAIIRIFETYLERYAEKSETKIDDIIIGRLKIPLYIIILLLGLHFALKYIEFPWLSEVEILIKIMGVVIGTWVTYRITDDLIKEYGYALARKTKSEIDDVIVPVVEKISMIFIFLIGFLVILNILNIDITPMIAGMGIAGLAVALAAQDTLSNMFSGFYLMADQPFRLGERLILDTGELCEVKQVGLRSTRLYNIIEHTMITIPNAELAKMKIVNLSQPDVKLRVTIPVGVAYGTDIEKVKKILLEIAEEAPHVLDDPSPVTFFTEFADFSLNLILIVWIDNIRKKLDVIDYINRKINQRFEEEGIEIPFPVRTIYMREIEKDINK